MIDGGGNYTHSNPYNKNNHNNNNIFTSYFIRYFVKVPLTKRVFRNPQEIETKLHAP